MLERLKSLIKTPEVEFLVEPEDFGVIAPPVPARKVMPEWFKKLPPYIENKQLLSMSKDGGPTIKRCAPVLDAMTNGWIIPLAADVEILSNDGATQINWRWLFYKDLVQQHGAAQVTGHPSAHGPPLKFLNYIYIKMPPGYSALFVPPLNRRDPRFECFSGQVDDTYMGNGALEYINFPFFFNQPNYTGIIKKGTPLVQMIPIKRDEVFDQSTENLKVQVMTAQDQELVALTRRRKSAHDSMYRDKLWHNAKEKQDE